MSCCLASVAGFVSLDIQASSLCLNLCVPESGIWDTLKVAAGFKLAVAGVTVYVHDLIVIALFLRFRAAGFTVQPPIQNSLLTVCV